MLRLSIELPLRVLGIGSIVEVINTQEPLTVGAGKSFVKVRVIENTLSKIDKNSKELILQDGTVAE